MSATPILLPDVELVVVDFFREQPFVTELGANVYTELPGHREGETQQQWESRVFPALRVNGFPGGTTRGPGVMLQARLQVDTWATSKWDTSRLARRAFAALHDTRRFRHEDADGLVSWFNGVATVNPPGWLPDEATKRPRYMFDVNVILRAGVQP
ncbi:MAG: hypothetical protein GEU78_16550 [Actinobacteria bacterium]|nr:hypothetical protein [Actinomycetota bacterium]